MWCRGQGTGTGCAAVYFNSSKGALGNTNEWSQAKSIRSGASASCLNGGNSGTRQAVASVPAGFGKGE